MSERLQLDIGSYKVGATSPATLNRSDSLGPIFGVIPRRLIKTSPAVFDRADWARNGVEFEIAFQMADDLPPRRNAYTPEEVFDRTQNAHVSIEIEDPHIEKPFSQPTETLYADNGAAGSCVIGPDIPDWRGQELKLIAMTAQANDGAKANTIGLNKRPDAIEVLHWTANACMNSGPGLKAGDCVSTGAIVAPIVLGSQSHWCAEFVRVGKVSVRFAS